MQKSSWKHGARSYARAIFSLVFGLASTTAFEQTSPSPNAATPATDVAPAMPTDPTALMLLVAKSNGLTGSDVQHWHLKASFKLLDAEGNTQQEGTIEEYWADPHKHRLTYTSTGYSQTTYWTGKDIMRYGDKNLPPRLVIELANQFVQPLPGPDSLEHQVFESKQLQAGPTKLDCLSLKSPQAPDGFPGLIGRGYCLDAEKPVLRISIAGQGADQYLRNKTVSFRGRYLPQEIRVVRTGKEIASAHLESIESLKTIEEADFTPPADAFPVQRQIAISSGVAQGNLVKSVPPMYPAIAKFSGTSGTVILTVLIDREGHVTDPQVVSGPPMLQQAAIDAVKQWVYRPYLLNGEKSK